LRLFASAALWSGIVRFILFWTLVGLGLVVASHIAPYSDWRLVYDVLKDVRAGLADRIAGKDFAFALSSGIVQVAMALAFAFLITHVLLIQAAIQAARSELGLVSSFRDFETRLDKISDRLLRNAIVSHGWRQFEQATLRRDDAVYNTVRPQVFINLADARERLFGLKMMGSIPGFFVGLGLLLTFIGLVLALNKAAGSTGAVSADAMTRSLNDLLAAATFKFSTSIAGLGSSLFLSLVFRSYQIWIEGAFDRFGRALENRMRFYPPQRLAAESLAVLTAQRDQLKEINSEGFFTRLGETVAPQLHSAMKDAVSPIGDRLDETVGHLARASRTGVDDLVRTFIDSLNQGAGRELTGVATTLMGLKDAMERIQTNLAGTGENLSSKLNDAADNVTRVLAEAGQLLSGSATSVAGTMKDAMAQVFLEMQESARLSKEAGQAAAEATKQAAQGALTASASAAEQALQTVRAGMDEVVSNLRHDIGHLGAALQTVVDTLAEQTRQIEAISARSRDTADAFARVASDVRSASQPLLTHSERIASSTDRMATTIDGSVAALSTAQDAARDLAEQLTGHFAQIGHVWEQYAARFRSVDEDFGRAADRFHAEVSRHQEAMRDFVRTIDEHTGRILGMISTSVNSLGESVETLNGTLSEFAQQMTPRGGAE
jgi:ABC-type transporter Mla subunit MlaD